MESDNRLGNDDEGSGARDRPLMPQRGRTVSSLTAASGGGVESNIPDEATNEEFMADDVTIPPPVVHATTLGVGKATEAMLEGNLRAAADSSSERDDTDYVAAAAAPFDEESNALGRRFTSLPHEPATIRVDAAAVATSVSFVGTDSAVSSPSRQYAAASSGARVPSASIASSLKSSPRFSPLAAQLNTIRKVAGKAVSRGGSGGSAGAGPGTSSYFSSSSADRYEVGESEEGRSESDASVSNRANNFIGGGLGLLSGGAATVVSALQKRSSHGSGGGGSSSSSSTAMEGVEGGDPVPTSISTRLNMLLLATSSRRSVPGAVRAERAARVRKAMQAATDEKGEPLIDPFPTQLHRVCANPEATLLHLQTELAKSPTSASVPDCMGRLPLHVLGDNTGLVSTAVGKATATKFGLQLMKVYPEAITASDNAGFYPFVGLIHDWEHYSYRNADKKHRSASSMLQPATRLFGRITDAVSQTGTGISNAMEKSLQAAASSFMSDPAVESSERGGQERRDGLSEGGSLLSFRNSFPRIAIWDEVEWCFDMLSIEMEELGGKSGGLYPVDNDATSEDFNERDLDARLLLAKHLPLKMPYILKTILLIDSGGDEGTTRKALLQSPLTRAMLLQPESVGDWLTAMIRKRGIASQVAVDYLAMVSGTTVVDHIGQYRPPMVVDKEDYELARTAVFHAIDALDGTVASLVTLGEKEIERAVSTTVIWCTYLDIMSQNLARPFVVSMSLIDLVLQIILLLAFRVRVSDPQYGYSSGPRIPTNIVYLICWNYFLRKGCQLVALASLSGVVLRNYLLNFGTLTDLLAIILVLVTYGFQDSNPGTYRNGLNTFVLGLLWLRILGFMKVVNKEMSTFIMALSQIMRDLLYFMIVLVVVILMFSDMFRIAITTNENGNFCQNALMNATDGQLDGALGDYCSPEFYFSVLRTYAVLIGDFNLDDFTATPGMIVLFVMFTMVGVVIFLSVLIAVICDSYEIAKLSSHRLFGKARVSFVAQNEALESFLKPGANPVVNLNASPTRIAATAFALLRWCVLLTLVVTAMYAEVFIVTQAVSSIINRTAYFTVIFMSVLAVVLTSALWILIIFAIGGVARAVAPGVIGTLVRFLDRLTESFSKAMAYRLFALSKAERTPFPTTESEEVEEEWQGRMAHMEQMVSKTGNRIRDELKAEMLALEKRLYEHEKVAALERRSPTPEPDNAAAKVVNAWDSFKVPIINETEEEVP